MPSFSPFLIKLRIPSKHLKLLNTCLIAGPSPYFLFISCLMSLSLHDRVGTWSSRLAGFHWPKSSHLISANLHYDFLAYCAQCATPQFPLASTICASYRRQARNANRREPCKGANVDKRERGTTASAAWYCNVAAEKVGRWRPCSKPLVELV